LAAKIQKLAMSVDPNGLDIEEYDDGRCRLTAEIWWH